MDKLNLFFPFDLGQRIGRLSAVREGVQLGEIVLPLDHARNALQTLLSTSGPQITKSRSAAQALLGFVTSLLADARANPAKTVNETLLAYGDKFWDQFTTSMQMELPFWHAYLVSQTLAWDTSILVENAAAMIPEEIQAKFPLEALTDWREAGRCIAFDLYTASGFHTIRSAEAVIRSYYAHIVGSLPKVKDRSWGAYTRLLRAHGGADEAILKLIDNIREHQRNPVMHPEERLDKQKAATLLSVCVGLVIQIGNAL